MHVRHCPACRCDYRPEIVNCADCARPLVDRDDDCVLNGESNAGAGPSDANAELVGFEAIRTSRDVYDLTPLADHLLETGVDCRIRDSSTGGRGVGYQLLVPAKDLAQASAALDALAQPDPGTDETFDSDAGYTRCPACSAPLAARAVVCPACDLQMGETTRDCPHCEARVDAQADRCGNCGETLDTAD